MYVYLLNLHFSTGNQVDQRFSILTKQLKGEIVTIEELVSRIENAPMIPKAKCYHLWFIYGWKDFISGQLTEPPLANHSKYHGFCLTRENGDVKLRAKRLPQHTVLVPKSGIRLMKDGHCLEKIGPADFRVEKIKFDAIMRGVNIHLSKLPLERRMSITASWDRLRKRLEDLPRKCHGFPKMDLSIFPKQSSVITQIPEHLQVRTDVPPLTGQFYQEEITDGSIDDEVAVNMDVCIYTSTRKWRPWLGRVVKVLENKMFLMQWYKRKSSQSSVFTAVVNSDGSPYINEISNESVMFWMISEPESRTSDSFSLSQYSLLAIEREYEEIDSK